MSLSALISMIVIITVVAGGFVYFLRTAMQKEAQKAAK